MPDPRADETKGTAMGISGHILGPKKLRAAIRLTGYEFDRAYRRGAYAEGRMVDVGGNCVHYSYDPKTGDVEKHPEDVVMHWSSCFENGRATPVEHLPGCFVRGPIKNCVEGCPSDA